MPNFFYTAKDLSGQSKTGTLSAKDKLQLAEYLKKEGLILIEAVSKDDGIGELKSKFDIPLPFAGVSLSEKILMARNLEVMFSAGLPLVKSLGILSHQSRNKKLKKVLSGVREKVSKGESFSQAIGGYPEVFSELFVNMVKVGEESGTLDEILRILALQFQKEHQLKSKIKNAMIYPLIIVIVMIVVGVIMVTFVLPNLKIFFETLDAKIPFYTKIMLDTGDYLYSNWYLMIVAPILLLGAVFLIIKTKIGKLSMDILFMRTPVIDQIIKKTNSALLIRSISSLLSSGVSLTRALEISSKTAGNHYFKEALSEASEKIKKGEKLSNALKEHQNIFPVGVVDMVEVGEETGNTSDIMKKLADFYEEEAAGAIESLTVIIEPALIIFLGLLAGLFAFSIIQPLYSSLQSIQ